MTREEEIKQRAKEIFDLPQCQALFMCGAEWADKTMIEKACEWLKANARYYVWRSKLDVDCGLCDELFNDFRKAMMEE